MSAASAGNPAGMLPEGAVPLFDCRFDRDSLAMVRTEIGRWGTANGLTDLQLANFVLAVNEITTNAVRHAGGRGGLMLWRDGTRLCCRISDSGPGIQPHHLDQARRPRPELVGGHGLWLARRICGGIEVDSDRGSGTRVLLTYPLPALDAPVR